MGRNRIQIDWIVFDRLCRLQCTLEELASWFDCSEDTIQRAVKRERKADFAVYYAQKRRKGLISLRRKQFQLATKGAGNTTMLIWLGKQYLGQNDAPVQPDASLESDLDPALARPDPEATPGTAQTVVPPEPVQDSPSGTP